MSGFHPPKASKSAREESSSSAKSQEYTVASDFSRLHTTLIGLLLQGIKKSQSALDPSTVPISQLKAYSEALRKNDPDSVKEIEEWIEEFERKAGKEDSRYLFDVCVCCGLAGHRDYIEASRCCEKQVCLNCILRQGFLSCPSCRVVYPPEKSASLYQLYHYWTASYTTHTET